MKEHEWVVEDLTRDKVWAIAKLQESHYGIKDDTADLSYLDYEFFQNPDGPTFGQIAWNEEKQEAAGGYELTAVRVKLGQTIEICFHNANSLTRASYRGQGVYIANVRRAFQRAQTAGYFMTYGFPNPNSYPIQIKKGLFEDLGAVPLLLRPLKPSGMVRSYLKSGVLATLARPFDGLFHPRNKGGAEVVRLTDDNLELADQFWSAVRNKYPILLIRDRQRLQYRFLDIPRRKYTCLFALKEGRPVAYASGRIMEVAGIQCAMMSDFLYLSENESEAKSLLRALMHTLQAQGADMAGCLMLSHTEEAHTLKKLGFFICPKFMEPQPFRFCLHTFRDQTDGPDCKDLKNWFFTMGDYDVV